MDMEFTLFTFPLKKKKKKVYLKFIKTVYLEQPLKT